MQTLPNLTGLRFFLAVLVVLFHVPQFCQNRGFPFFYDLPVFQKGTEAVYMFFSLSGFLIIRQLYLEKAFQKTINLKAFFIRRALRILPLYYLVLTVGFLYYRVVLPHLGYPQEYSYELLTGILLSVTIFPNIFFTYYPGGVLEILWSIGVEEQFYILFAPLLFVLPLNRIKPFLLLFTVGYMVVYFAGGTNFLRDYQMLFFYFSFSGLCSVLFLKEGLAGRMKAFKLPIFVLILLYFSTNLFIDYLPEVVYHLAGMLLFGLGISLLAQKPIGIFENKHLVYLGKISYGIYMLHPIVKQVVGFLFL